MSTIIEAQRGPEQDTKTERKRKRRYLGQVKVAQVLEQTMACC